MILDDTLDAQSYDYNDDVPSENKLITYGEFINNFKPLADKLDIDYNELAVLMDNASNFGLETNYDDYETVQTISLNKCVSYKQKYICESNWGLQGHSSNDYVTGDTTSIFFNSLINKGYINSYGFPNDGSHICNNQIRENIEENLGITCIDSNFFPWGYNIDYYNLPNIEFVLTYSEDELWGDLNIQYIKMSIYYDNALNNIVSGPPLIETQTVDTTVSQEITFQISNKRFITCDDLLLRIELQFFDWNNRPISINDYQFNIDHVIDIDNVQENESEIEGEIYAYCFSFDNTNGDFFSGTISSELSVVYPDEIIIDPNLNVAQGQEREFKAFQKFENTGTKYSFTFDGAKLELPTSGNVILVSAYYENGEYETCGYISDGKIRLNNFKQNKNRDNYDYIYVPLWYNHTTDNRDLIYCKLCDIDDINLAMQYQEATIDILNSSIITNLNGRINFYSTIPGTFIEINSNFESKEFSLTTPVNNTDTMIFTLEMSITIDTGDKQHNFVCGIIRNNEPEYSMSYSRGGNRYTYGDMILAADNNTTYNNYKDKGFADEINFDVTPYE